jgi:D-lactate dehydrogenase (cytochrome)
MELKPALPEYRTYLRDESRLEGRAGYIAFPENTFEAADLIRQTANEGRALTIQGARTGISGGAAPDGGLVLSTEKMRSPLGCHIDNEGRPILRVQAGINLADLRAFLDRGAAPADWPSESRTVFADLCSRGRYRFSPNPTETSATLGGVFAVNARGPNSLRYGASAVHIAELVWITPRGEIWELERGRYTFDEQGCTLPDGSRLAVEGSIPRGAFSFLHPSKGMDLIDFLAGSEGRAGMAAELTLALRRAPAVSWAVVFFFRSPLGALDFASALSRWRKNTAGELLSSAEYYDRASLEIVGKGAAYVTALRQLPVINPEFQSAIHVELEGDEPESLEAALAELLDLFTGCGGREDDTWAAVDSAEVEKYRLLRHGVPECINMEVDRIRQGLPGFCKAALDFQFSSERAAYWDSRYHNDLAEAGLRGFVFGHILEGRLHVNLLAEDAEEFRRCQRLVETWAASVLEEGGLLSAENGIGKIKVPLAHRFLSPRRLVQIQDILACLDPQGILGGFLKDGAKT